MTAPSVEEMEKLLESASEVAKRAWCPYSHFPVGAAILMRDGRVVVGCNVENASYGLSNCAERTAVFSAVALGYGRGDFIALAIYTPGKTANSPCGACRQVLAEFFDSRSPVWSCCDGDDRMEWTVKGLLPDGFGF